MKRSMIAVIGLAVVVGLASSALAAPTIYTLTPLTGYTGINVSAINDSAAAVGYCTNTTGGGVAFIWTQGGGMQALNGSGYYARDINNIGQIVGDSNTTNAEQSIYWASATATAQAITAAGSKGGIAYEINELGQVVGRAGYLPNPPGRKAYVWDSTTGAISFITGVDEFQAINDSGVAVGSQRSRYDTTTSTMTVIGSGVTADTWGTGRAINNAGSAVGNLGSVTGGFLQASDGAITPLGALTGYTASQTTPMGINELGQVVGDCGYGAKAFIWENGTMTDLNTVLGNSSWILKNANDINESGWIVGQATYNSAAVGYVMTPEPATLALMGLGGVAALLRRRRK